MTQIQVHEVRKREGKCITFALIGPWGEMFEIYLHDGQEVYYVEDNVVSAEMYKLALDTAALDQSTPDDFEDPPEPASS